VKHPSARPEILFVCRQNPESTGINENTRDAHVAFPGGRTEEGDEGGLYTGMQSLFLSLRPCSSLLSFYPAMRQTWEEIGLDLAESDYTCVGQLDDREITTSLGKRLLMILSPFGQLPLLFLFRSHFDLSKFSFNLPQPKHLSSLFLKPPSTGYH
jgi:8-oxo-dGTP pyrophosphatase MutT (NUDIX family)